MAMSSLGFFLQNLIRDTPTAKAEPKAKAATG